jgi:hypothetical protein
MINQPGFKIFEPPDLKMAPLILPALYNIQAKKIVLNEVVTDGN